MKTSTKPLAAGVEKEIAHDLYVALAGMQTAQEVAQFMHDFYSQTEVSVFAKRLAIAMMLSQGESYDSITKKLKVSTATVATTTDFIETKGFKLVLEKLNIDAWADNLSKKLWPFG